MREDQQIDVIDPTALSGLQLHAPLQVASLLTSATPALGAVVLVQFLQVGQDVLLRLSLWAATILAVFGIFARADHDNVFQTPRVRLVFSNLGKRARMLRRLASFFLVFLGLSAAQANECDVTIAEEATVASVIDGGSFMLTDGRRVRLAGIEAPRTGWPLAVEATVNLAKLIEGKTIDLGYADRGTDRHGDLLAYAFFGKAWLQGELIDGGFARAYSRSDTRRCAAELLNREAEARAAKRGMWANAFYSIRKADDLGPDIGTFQIIEGKIASVKVGRDRAFLNFGADYRTDFTVTISARDLKRFAKEGIDPAKWNAKSVRVRGWLSLLNGPEIELTHAEQVELLD